MVSNGLTGGAGGVGGPGGQWMHGEVAGSGGGGGKGGSGLGAGVFNSGVASVVNCTIAFSTGRGGDGGGEASAPMAITMAAGVELAAPAAQVWAV